MKEISIRGCGECPFRYTNWDDFAVGNDTLEICTISMNLGFQKYFIDCYDTKNEEEPELLTPDWCPLKQNSILFKYDGEN